MYNRIKSLFWITVSTMILLPGCKKWDEHNRITDEGVSISLVERIQANPDLSKFADLLVKSGYADTVALSKTFTIYAPTNAALASLSPSVENDASALKKFVANHIASQSYYSAAVQGTIRIPMLNGKHHSLTSGSIDGVPISLKDQLAKNGVVQAVAEALPVLSNIWEFVSTGSKMPQLQKVAMADSLASQIRSRVFDLCDESKTFTLFVLKDVAWQSEVNKFKPFYATGNADSTANLAAWAVVKDLAVDMLYTNASAIPDTIVSKFGVKLGIDKSAIAETIKTSNGVVYIMNQLVAAPQHKFREIIIEAENYNSASANRISNTFIRDKKDSATGGIFRDVLVYNHGLAQFNLRYRLTEMPSIKYRAYWMALNDNINGMTVPFSQKIGVDSFNSPLPAYAVVELNTYAEQFAGEFQLPHYKPVFNLYLVAANNTTANTNALVCNYIRLVPVF